MIDDEIRRLLALCIDGTHEIPIIESSQDRVLSAA